MKKIKCCIGSVKKGKPYNIEYKTESGETVVETIQIIKCYHCGNYLETALIKRSVNHG